MGARISGVVFNDLNHNGVQDANEGGILGSLVELLDSMGHVIASTTTGPDGSYVFADLNPGTYSVRQTNLPGFISTTPDLVTVTLSFDEATVINFGDVQLPDLSIEKTVQRVLTITQGGTYVINVSNIGNGPTVGPITVTDPLAAALTLVSASGPGWDCSASTAQQMECVSTAVLMGHQSAPPITLQVTVQPGALRQVIQNTVTVSTAFDTGPGNNSSTASSPVTRPAPVPLLSAQGLIALLGILLLIAALGVRQLRAGMAQTGARAGRKK
jgi:uncharacterized repeat protein (TIGR01451 family)